MSPLTLPPFVGLNTFDPPHAIGAGEVTLAQNAAFDNGSAVPIKQLGAAVSTGLVGSQLAIYKLGNNWLGSSSVRRWWAEWNGKAFWVSEGSAPPKYSNGSTTLDLGITAPTAGMSAATAGAGNVTTSGYYLTYVNSFGDESGPSPIASVSASSNTVNLTNIPVSAQTGVVYKNIYRVNGSAVQYVAQIANATTSYSDNVAAASLGDAITTTGFSPAPNLQGLAGFYAGRLWGWIGNKLYYSDDSRPHLWSLAYIDGDIKENIVGGIPCGDGLLIVTAAQGYVIRGKDEGSFSVDDDGERYGCQASLSLVTLKGGALYWSDQGLVMYQRGRYELLSARKLSKADIDAVDLDTVKAGRYREQYLLFHDGGGIIADLKGVAVRFATTDQTADAVFTDKTCLYLSTGGAVKEWAAGTANRTMVIQTGEFTGGDMASVFHIRKAAVEHDASMTAQWYKAGSSWGSARTKTRTSQGRSTCWAKAGLRKRGSLRLTTSGTVYGITINPEDKRSA